MAIKFYSSTLTFHCPKCKTVLKKERHDDAFRFLCVFLFIPVGLIALIVYLIKKAQKKMNLTNIENKLYVVKSAIVLLRYAPMA